LGKILDTTTDGQSTVSDLLLKSVIIWRRTLSTAIGNALDGDIRLYHGKTKLALINSRMSSNRVPAAPLAPSSHECLVSTADQAEVVVNAKPRNAFWRRSSRHDSFALSCNMVTVRNAAIIENTNIIEMNGNNSTTCQKLNRGARTAKRRIPKEEIVTSRELMPDP